LYHGAPLLFEAIARAAQWRLHTFTARQVAKMAWSFAKLNHRAPLLFQALARSAHGRIDEFDPQAISNFAWALAVFDLDKTIELWTDHESPFHKAVQSVDPKPFNVQGLFQLHQFYLCCKERNKAAWIPEGLSQACMAAFVSRRSIRSTLQKNEVKALLSLGDVTLVEEEVRTETGYSVDVLLQYKGPFHFLRHDSELPMGNLF
jgi:hypothetical protein